MGFGFSSVPFFFNQFTPVYTFLVHILVATWLQYTLTDSQATSTMTSETLAKSLESDRKSGQGVAILVLVLVIVLGVYWFAVRSSHQVGDPEKEAEEDVDGCHPTEEDYEYMDDDDFDEDDLDDEDYDLLEESDDEEEESDDVRISDLLNETLL